MKVLPSFRYLSDAELTEEVARLARSERECSVALIASLEEFDRRKLFLPAGYRSLYMYCTQHLRLGEGAAYNRIEAARASRRFPVILERLAEGSITLATIGLVARHLTDANHLALLEETRHKAKREVEVIVAGLAPKPDVKTMIRRVSKPAHDAALPAPSPPISILVPRTETQTATMPTRPVIAPLTPERFKLQITMDRETHDTLREIQDLIRHAVPSGDAAIIVSRALKLLREQLLRHKAAQVRRPRLRLTNQSPAPADDTSIECGDLPPRSRHIPATVKRAVWVRDGARCAFVGKHGRCVERSFLEFHHVRPFAADGATDDTNLELRCQVHNGYEADLFFGHKESPTDAATAG